MTDPPRGAAFLGLVAVMDRLRSPGGCPWDAEQTHESLLEYLLEEAYETIEAVETGDDTLLREELGDLLLQVVFHARIAEESPTPWTIDDVAAGITAKLVRRHPHVFGGDLDPSLTAADVQDNWTRLKSREKQRTSSLDGVPQAMPALMLAQKSWRRAAESGVVVDPPAVAAGSSAEIAIEVGSVGELLLAIAVAAEQAGIDAEAQLRSAIRGLHDRIRTAEAT